MSKIHAPKGGRKGKFIPNFAGVFAPHFVREFGPQIRTQKPKIHDPPPPSPNLWSVPECSPLWMERDLQCLWQCAQTIYHVNVVFFVVCLQKDQEPPERLHCGETHPLINAHKPLGVRATCMTLLPCGHCGFFFCGLFGEREGSYGPRFCKGNPWLPLSSLPSRPTSEQHRRVVRREREDSRVGD